MLKLPKNILAHPNVKAIEALFSSDMRYLYSEGRIQVPQWRFDDQMQRALQDAFNSKNLIQGLEGIGDHLDKELKGLKALKKLPGQAQNERLSRLIILSNDGSERFYHNAESILTRHGDRAMVCIVQATSEQFGELFTKKSNPAKALMIDERKALETFLAAIAEAK